MKTQDIKNMASAYMQVQEKSKMDKVDPKALKKDFDDREDKDIDNDGDTDASDEYLHNRRKAVKNAMKKEAKDYGPGHIGAVQKMLDKEREAKKAKASMKKEEVELDEAPQPKWKVEIGKKHYTVTARNTAEADKKARMLAKKDSNYGIGGKIERMAEEVELDELSKKTLGSYIKKADDDRAQNAFKVGKSGKINFKGIKGRRELKQQ